MVEKEGPEENEVIFDILKDSWIKDKVTIKDMVIDKIPLNKSLVA